MLRLLRRISAVLIALCLALPESSCTQTMQRQSDVVTVQVMYPLQNQGNPAWLALALATFLAPAALSLLRARAVVLALAVLSGGWFLFRAYYVVTFDKPEIGWYVSGSGAVVYTAASLAELWRMLSRRWRRRGSIHPPPLSASG